MRDRQSCIVLATLMLEPMLGPGCWDSINDESREYYIHGASDILDAAARLGWMFTRTEAEDHTGNEV
mgnify:CR=1 FL=1